VTAPPSAGAAGAAVRVATATVTGVARDAAAAVTGVVTRVVTPLGWLVTAFVVVAWVAGRALGWAELVLAAVLGAVELVAGVGLTLGRSGVTGAIELERDRVTAGESVTARLELTGSTRRRLPLTVELPVGAPATGTAAVTVRRVDVPGSAPGTVRREAFTIDTDRRGVIVVGPATTVRGDPFGLLRRAAPLTGARTLFVHPVTVALRPLAGGLLRDLEGRTTEDVSMSDLAFHALRAYAPGDDRRHIHWRSSARALSADAGEQVGLATGGSGLLVRQFNDTRRSHLMVVVDGDLGAYQRPDDLELAMSVGASVAVRAMREEIGTTVVASDQLATGRAGRRAMDAFALATPTTAAPAELVARGLRATPEVTTALLVTGSAREFTELRRAAAWFPPEVTVAAVRVDPAGRTAVARAGALVVLDVAALADLPGVLRAGRAAGSRA
jgi:uncharacterized protein (DUF58 family)